MTSSILPAAMLFVSVADSQITGEPLEVEFRAGMDLDVSPDPIVNLDRALGLIAAQKDSILRDRIKREAQK